MRYWSIGRYVHFKDSLYLNQMLFNNNALSIIDDHNYKIFSHCIFQGLELMGCKLYLNFIFSVPFYTSSNCNMSNKYCHVFFIFYLFLLWIF